jgi:hypothetical protein
MKISKVKTIILAGTALSFVLILSFAAVIFTNSDAQQETSDEAVRKVIPTIKPVVLTPLQTTIGYDLKTTTLQFWFLQGCVILALRGCVIVALQSCVIFALQGCVIVASQGWVIVALQGCMIVALQGCVIVELQGCVIIVLQGCVIVVLQGCVSVLLRARLRDCLQGCVIANAEN